MESNNLLMSQHWLEQYLCIPYDKVENVSAARLENVTESFTIGES
jgi:hypothetical protein